MKTFYGNGEDKVIFENESKLVILNGVEPKRLEKGMFNYCYQDLAMKLSFTGEFYMCYGRIPCETGYLHQLPRLEQYKNILLIKAQDGTVVEFMDVTNMVKSE